MLQPCPHSLRPIPDHAPIRCMGCSMEAACAPSYSPCLHATAHTTLHATAHASTLQLTLNSMLQSMPPCYSSCLHAASCLHATTHASVLQLMPPCYSSCLCATAHAFTLCLPHSCRQPEPDHPGPQGRLPQCDQLHQRPATRRQVVRRTRPGEVG